MAHFTAAASTNVRVRPLTAACSTEVPNKTSKKVVLGCGTVVIDYLACVASYPQPDEKIRTVDFQFQGGGNVGNSLTGAARLGLKPVLISKVANDPLGERILKELEDDGVDTSHVVVSKGGVSPFTYVIIDKEKVSRTCIHTPGQPSMLPSELDTKTILNILTETDLVFFDGRLGDTALEIAKLAVASDVPILMDAEKKREHLDELIQYVDYLVTSSKFPQAWTGEEMLGEALLTMALRLPRLKFVIVTLGEHGCVMLERQNIDGNENETLEVNMTLNSLQKVAEATESERPYVVSSKVGRFVRASESSPVFGRFLVSTCEKVPFEKLVDTTGAGDAFVGAVMYCLCSGLRPEKMLPFAATVAAANCQAVGARAGLLKIDDPRISTLC